MSLSQPVQSLICVDQWRSNCAIKLGLHSALNSYAKMCRLCATMSAGLRANFSQPRTAPGIVGTLGAPIVRTKDFLKPREVTAPDRLHVPFCHSSSKSDQNGVDWSQPRHVQSLPVRTQVSNLPEGQENSLARGECPAYQRKMLQSKKQFDTDLGDRVKSGHT